MAVPLLKMVSPVLTILFFLIIKPSAGAGGLVGYWGQNMNEESLKEICDTSGYSVVNVAFLNVFGNGQTPSMNLTGHCDPAAGTCTKLSSEIKYCQRKGIKVMLSIGGEIGNYSLVSSLDAKKFADYLWNNFLGGRSDFRPLGDVVLDGIHFVIGRFSSQHYITLLSLLSKHNSQFGNTFGKNVYLSAAVQCLFQDTNLDKAMKTGLFNYVSVQFFNNPECMYIPGNTTKLFNSWKKWTSSVKAEKIFMELPTSPGAAPNGGYIPAKLLISDVLPTIEKSIKYGGVMLWYKLFDGDYGALLKEHIKKEVKPLIGIGINL